MSTQKIGILLMAVGLALFIYNVFDYQVYGQIPRYEYYGSTKALMAVGAGLATIGGFLYWSRRN